MGGKFFLPKHNLEFSMILVLSDAPCMISETLSKPEISSIFHFDQVNDGQRAHVLGVKAFSLSLFYENCLSSN